jgi:prepilin-type processing-associated H-X9-DG protein
MTSMSHSNPVSRTAQAHSLLRSRPDAQRDARPDARPGARPNARPNARRGLTLTDVIVVVALGVLLSGSVLSAGIFGSREKSNRIKCANNLKQIGLAALMYVNQDVRSGSYPRTYWDTTSTKLIVDTTGYGKKDSFDRKDTGDNNVTASFFLILKTQEITPGVFVCPTTAAKPGFGKGTKIGVQDSSNWEAIPGNLSYSYNCPFPTQDAVKEGWKFNGTVGSDFAIAADMNPGGDALLKVTCDAGAEQMKAVNSRNHRSEGQNVLYCDGHVDWQQSPFCGMVSSDRTGKSRDNIYTYGGPNDKKGGDGIVGPATKATDNVLLPIDEPPQPPAIPAEPEKKP